MSLTNYQLETNPADRLPRMHICAYAIAWMLIVPLLYFAAQGAPSIDRVSRNVQTAYYGQQTASDTTQGRIEQVVVYSILILVLAPHLHKIMLVAMQNKILALLPVVALMSSAWSQDPWSTFKTSATLMLLSLFGVYLTIRFSTDQQTELFLFVGTIVISLSIVLVLFFPNIGLQHTGTFGSMTSYGAWQGICDHKNKFATVLVYLLMPALYYKATSLLQKTIMAIYILSVTLCVIMSQARTGWLLLALSVSVASVIKWQTRFRKKERLLFVLALVMVGALSIWVAFNYYAQIALLLGKDPTLTGRIFDYRAIRTEISQEPIWGYGYMAFFGSGESMNFALRSGLIGLGNAENPVLQIWLELGEIGVICLFLSLLVACRNAALCLMNAPSRYIQWCILMVFLNLTSLLGGDKIMYPHTIQWLSYVIGYIGLSSEARRIRSQRRA